MKNTQPFQVIYDSAIRLSKLIESVSLTELVTPANLASARRAWFDLIEYNILDEPLFVYNEAHLKACLNKANRIYKQGKLLIKALEPETPVDTAIIHILQRRIDDAILTCEIASAMYSNDNVRTRELLVEKFGMPDKAEMDQAYAMMQDNQRPISKSEPMFSSEERDTLKNMSIDFYELRLLFDFALVYYGFEDWHCELRKNVSRVDVRTTATSPKNRNRIDIPSHKKQRYNGLHALELVAHEVEYHVRNIENSQQLMYELLGDQSPLLPLIGVLAKADDESLYEGVAKNSDVRISGQKSAPDPYYIIAINLALNGGTFAEIAGTILANVYDDRMDKKTLRAQYERVWNICYRVFRGMQCSGFCDNNDCYAFVKDYAYLSGFKQVQEMDPIWRDFASMRYEDIEDLVNAGVTLTPHYPYRRVAREIWDRRNTKNSVAKIFADL